MQCYLLVYFIRIHTDSFSLITAYIVIFNLQDGAEFSCIFTHIILFCWIYIILEECIGCLCACKMYLLVLIW